MSDFTRAVLFRVTVHEPGSHYEERRDVVGAAFNAARGPILKRPLFALRYSQWNFPAFAIGLKGRNLLAQPEGFRRAG